MAKSLATKTSFLAMLFLFLIVAASEMRTAEAKYCWKKSHKWSGPCLHNYNCSHHCQHYGYKYGLCTKQRWGHWKHWKYSCICYFHC